MVLAARPWPSDLVPRERRAEGQRKMTQHDSFHDVFDVGCRASFSSSMIRLDMPMQSMQRLAMLLSATRGLTQWSHVMLMFAKAEGVRCVDVCAFAIAGSHL